MAEAAHGTAPSLEGKDVANPMAMILAAAALLVQTDDEACAEAGRAIREATPRGGRGGRPHRRPRRPRTARPRSPTR